MLITFSPDYSGKYSPRDLEERIAVIGREQRLDVSIGFARRQERGQIQVRFTLPGATFDQHDDVIRALLQLDPGAEIRTAKAMFHGLDDFERQYKASAAP